MCSRSFHNFRAATENGWSPLSFNLGSGTLRSSWSADREIVWVCRDAGAQGVTIGTDRLGFKSKYKNYKMNSKGTGTRWSKAKIRFLYQWDGGPPNIKSIIRCNPVTWCGLVALEKMYSCQLNCENLVFTTSLIWLSKMKHRCEALPSVKAENKSTHKHTWV